MKTLRLAFVIEIPTGIVLMTCDASQMRNVTVEKNQLVHVSDDYMTPRPDVYYDFASKSLKPKKAFKLKQDGPKIKNIPQGSRVDLEGQSVEVNDGELYVEGAAGVQRHVVVRHPHFVPQLVAVECNGYGEDLT